MFGVTVDMQTNSNAHFHIKNTDSAYIFSIAFYFDKMQSINNNSILSSRIIS